MGEWLSCSGFAPPLLQSSALLSRVSIERSFRGIRTGRDGSSWGVRMSPVRKAVRTLRSHSPRRILRRCHWLIDGTSTRSFACGQCIGPGILLLTNPAFSKQGYRSKTSKFPCRLWGNGRPSEKPEHTPWWREVLLRKLNEEDFVILDGDEVNDLSDAEEGEETYEDLDSGELDDVDRMLSDDLQYFSWQQQRDATDEMRDYQETGRDLDNDDWKDWLDVSVDEYGQYIHDRGRSWYSPQSEWEKGGIPREPPKKPERGMNRTIKEFLLRIFEVQEEVEDDLSFEEKVFRFTSRSTAKFLIILILVPWAVSFLVHDFVVVPFLRKWVQEVPLAAKTLDVRESQKLYMIDRLKLERQRVRFESEIGKAPPLSDDELNEYIHEEALELREELREENRQSFANIWSDAVAGFTIFLLLIFNREQVAILRMTGDRLFTNISDTGKAFIIILCTDIFLGYHSESGWETVIEMLLDHYGLEASQPSIYIFVAIVPVTIDACFKLWVFRYLTRLSPSAAATFREMKRH